MAGLLIYENGSTYRIIKGCPSVLRQPLYFLFPKIETLFEAVDTSASVYELLLTREEWVAFRANINNDILLRGASLDYVTARTTDGGLLILGMDSLFQWFHLFPREITDINQNCTTMIPQIMWNCKLYFNQLTVTRG